MSSIVSGDAKSLSLFQQFSRGHSPRGDVVHPLSVVATASRGSPVRTRHRYLSRDGAVLVEPVWADVRRKIRKRRIHHGSYSQWRWHLDEVFVRINGEMHYLWRAVDHEGEVLEVLATKRRDRKAALRFLKRTMKRYGRPKMIVTDRLKSYRAAMNVIAMPPLRLAVSGSTIEPKTRTNRSVDEKARWPGSETSRPSRSLLPLTPRSTIISIRNVIFITARTSNSIAPPLWPSGVNLQPEIYRPREFQDLSAFV